MSDTEITMRHLANKLEHIHASVEKNSNDIMKLKLEMSYGRGAVKSVLWIGSCVALIVGLMRIFNGG
tara:strand:- start:12137 stop:12337 length:201 start_codon:yes stop_codon:yes gene_type:complete